MKNKEIEELLNKFKNADSQQFNELVEDFDNVYKLLSYIEQLEKELKEEQEDNYKQSEWLVKKQKKIEQLENDYKEANESITWWQNRFNAIKRDKKQIENNRDKAIEYIEKHLYKWYDLNGEEYTEPREFEKNTDASILIDILKGDSE